MKKGFKIVGYCLFWAMIFDMIGVAGFLLIYVFSYFLNLNII